MELGRIAARYGVEPPGLVKLEREIEREEAGCLSPSSHLPLSFFPPTSLYSPSESSLPTTPSPPPPPPSPPAPLSPSTTCLSETLAASLASDLPSATTNPVPTCLSPPQSSLSASNPCTSTASTQTPLFSSPCTTNTSAPTQSAPSLGQTLVSTAKVSSTAINKHTPAATPPITSPPAALTPRSSKSSVRRSTGTNSLLDDIVRNIVENPPCCCPTRFLVVKQPKGCYRVGEKVLYIRMLNERQVMVRVGGGWETFISYLQKHDPCRGGGPVGRSEVRVCRDKAKLPSLNTSPDSYMVVGAYYRGKK